MKTSASTRRNILADCNTTVTDSEIYSIIKNFIQDILCFILHPVPDLILLILRYKLVFFIATDNHSHIIMHFSILPPNFYNLLTITLPFYINVLYHTNVICQQMVVYYKTMQKAPTQKTGRFAQSKQEGYFLSRTFSCSYERPRTSAYASGWG